jgi:hypothetical protein
MEAYVRRSESGHSYVSGELCVSQAYVLKDRYLSGKCTYSNFVQAWTTMLSNEMTK